MTRILSWCSALAIVLAGVVAGAPAAEAAGDPPSNSDPHLIKACGTGVLTFSDACIAGALSDFDAARAKEGVGNLVLPSNFASLTPAQALFVLANIDRVDRGLPPIDGLSSTLNAIAQVGADNHADPNFPPGGHYTSGGSNWAATKNALWSEFLWMYDDGPGSGNLDCVSAGDPGCWGHRHNILGSYASPIYMGAAAGSTGNAEIFLGGDTRGDSGDVFTWAAELPYFPAAGTAPGKVTWKKAAVHGHRVTLTWKAPGGPVTGFRVTAGKRSWEVTKARLKTHLRPGVYRFRVRAENAAGVGPRSKKLTVRVRKG